MLFGTIPAVLSHVATRLHLVGLGATFGKLKTCRHRLGEVFGKLKTCRHRERLWRRGVRERTRTVPGGESPTISCPMTSGTRR